MPFFTFNSIYICNLQAMAVASEGVSNWSHYHRGGGGEEMKGAPTISYMPRWHVRQQATLYTDYKNMLL